jgi:hypothetical protein
LPNPAIARSFLPNVNFAFKSGTGQQPEVDYLRFRIMQYRDVEYQVVQTSNPTGWKWTVQFDGKRSTTGTGFNRIHAIALAQRAIDKAIKASMSVGVST